MDYGISTLVILNPTGYMLNIFQFYFNSFDVYSKIIGNSPEVSDFNRLLFLKLKPLVHL